MGDVEHADVDGGGRARRGAARRDVVALTTAGLPLFGLPNETEVQRRVGVAETAPKAAEEHAARAEQAAKALEAARRAAARQLAAAEKDREGL